MLRKFTLRYFLILISMICLMCKSQDDKSSFKDKVKACQCNLLSAQNQIKWKEDSIGMNGFRIDLIRRIRKECHLTNHKWSEIEFFFEKPEYTVKFFPRDSFTRYQYRIKNQTPRDLRFNAAGNTILNFELMDIDSTISDVYFTHGE